MATGSSQHGGDDGRRGRHAAYPWQIPLLGWWRITCRIRRELFNDNIFIVSAGVAFFGLLGVFPILSAVASFYGLITTRAQLNHQLQALNHLLPGNVSHMLGQSLGGLVGGSHTALGVGMAASAVFALWAATRGMLGLINALNIVYDHRERRSTIHVIAVAVVLAIGALLFWIFALLLVVGLPVMVAHLTQGSSAALFITAGRWVVLAVVGVLSMALIYRFGPSPPRPQWHWLSFGAIVATLLWFAGSLGFSFYLSRFGGINRIYGSLGVIMIAQVWFFLTAFIFLLGAEINIEMQRQTQTDNTRIRRRS